MKFRNFFYLPVFQEKIAWEKTILTINKYLKIHLKNITSKTYFFMKNK